MLMKGPHALTDKEWQELSDLPEVHEGFGLWSSVPGRAPDQLKEMSYACKFDFFSTTPGYVGEVFLLFGDSLEPEVFIRDHDGKLKAA